jgi:signal transduction histidine kinase
MRKALPVLIYDIKDGATRIDRIVTDLKGFARPNEPNMKVLFSLNDVVERAVRLLNHLVSRKTRHFKLKLHERLALLRGDPQQMEQVIVNLLVNALESLPDPERGVTVSTFPDTVNHQICLEILDEGVGIDPGHLERLCNPFFTTKQATGGTGLGLAITSSLVRAHAGNLSFSSKLGEGTCARIVFPESPS